MVFAHVFFPPLIGNPQLLYIVWTVAVGRFKFVVPGNWRERRERRKVGGIQNGLKKAVLWFLWIVSALCLAGAGVSICVGPRVLAPVAF